MAPDSIRTLARNLDVPERTLRRAAAEGLIHGERLSERRFRTTLREEAYLRSHWSLLSLLRAALRTERNVRAAVLFGSAAMGREAEHSDLDLLVWLRERDPAAVASLAGRLGARVSRDVQLVRSEDAERSPALMADVLVEGRVLVDRDGLWPAVKAAEASWRRREAAQVSLADATLDLELS